MSDGLTDSKNLALRQQLSDKDPYCGGTVRIELYKRTRSDAGIYYYRCVDCKRSANVWSFDRQHRDNKLLKSGLCPACFEVALEAKMRILSKGMVDENG